MSRKPQPGVVTRASPLKIVSQRKRYTGEPADPADRFEVGAVVDFQPDGTRARAVRARSFQGAIVFSGLRDWAPGRHGIVTQVWTDQQMATIVDLPSGELVRREGYDRLRVGDLVGFDLMSDLAAVDLELIQPTKQR